MSAGSLQESVCVDGTRPRRAIGSRCPVRPPFVQRIAVADAPGDLCGDRPDRARGERMGSGGCPHPGMTDGGADPRWALVATAAIAGLPSCPATPGSNSLIPGRCRREEDRSRHRRRPRRRSGPMRVDIFCRSRGSEPGSPRQRLDMSDGKLHEVHQTPRKKPPATGSTTGSEPRAGRCRTGTRSTSTRAPAFRFPQPECSRASWNLAWRHRSAAQTDIRFRFVSGRDASRSSRVHQPIAAQNCRGSREAT